MRTILLSVFFGSTIFGLVLTAKAFVMWSGPTALIAVALFGLASISWSIFVGLE